MKQEQVLVDPDTLSAILLQNLLVIAKSEAYLQQYSRFTFSVITRYEIRRGLKAKAVNKQLKVFEQFCVKLIAWQLSLTINPIFVNFLA